MFQPPLEELTLLLDDTYHGYTFSVDQPQPEGDFAGDPFPYPTGIYLSGTFDNAGFSSDSGHSSLLSSPVIRGLDVPSGDCDANSISSCELSPASPQSPLGTFLEPPPFHNSSRRKSASFAENPVSSLNDLRRYPSSLSLGDRYGQQQISEISQNVRKMSLGIETTSILEASKRDPVSAFITDGPKPSYGGSTTSLIPAQTQLPDGPPFRATPTPSPVSPVSPLLPIDDMVRKDCLKKSKSRSKKDKEASLRRRKTQGLGEFLCEVCGDDFTTMHRLQGHKESKHYGVKFRCDACNVELRHRTSYDRHIKKTCLILNPRATRK